MKQYKQLCWDCQRAVGGCPWSRHGKPIKGWKARRTKINAYQGTISSYDIEECPLFIPDAPREANKIDNVNMPLRMVKQILGASKFTISKLDDDVLIEKLKQKGYTAIIRRTPHGNVRKIYSVLEE